MNNKLSICITVKNRSKVETELGILSLFPNCLKSIQESIEPQSDIELIISDWESTDWPLTEWIGNIITEAPVEIIKVKTKDNSFSAGKGRNIAASKANGDMLLFLDADMLVTHGALYNAWGIAKSHGVCYPVIMYQKEYQSSEYMVHEGGGILFIDKDLFTKAGRWPEYYGHGFEDIDLAKAIQKLTPLQTSPIPLYHQWHPQDKEWKNRYAKTTRIVEQRQHHYQVESTEHLDKWVKGGLKQVMSNTNFNK